jgi:Kef-type K+ transport system membrane component KefB
VLAGILLGPSLLGQIAPAAMHYLQPPAIAPILSNIAQVGVMLFMFLVGLELDTARLGRRTRAMIVISQVSIVVPFLLGMGLAVILYPRLSSADVPFTVFSLFLGVSLSVTAFPVLARILTDRGLQGSDLGLVALSCAAVGDVTAWCLLAFVTAVASAALSSAWITFALSGLYVALMVGVVRPLVVRAVRAQELRGTVSQGAIALAIAGMLVSALATEAAGIHAIFGAFLAGALIPHDSRLAQTLTRALADLVVVLFLPVFFASTGMRTEIGLVSGAAQWLLCGLIIVTASAGKFGGTFAAARVMGFGGRDAAALGVLMNTRGLMELIVLNVGLERGILSPTLFAMLVLMAVVTTFATTPLLDWLMRQADAPAAEPVRP